MSFSNSPNFLRVSQTFLHLLSLLLGIGLNGNTKRTFVGVEPAACSLQLSLILPSFSSTHLSILAPLTPFSPHLLLAYSSFGHSLFICLTDLYLPPHYSSFYCLLSNHHMLTPIFFPCFCAIRPSIHPSVCGYVSAVNHTISYSHFVLKFNHFFTLPLTSSSSFFLLIALPVSLSIYPWAGTVH